MHIYMHKILIKFFQLPVSHFPNRLPDLNPATGCRLTSLYSSLIFVDNKLTLICLYTYNND